MPAHIKKQDMAISPVCKKIFFFLKVFATMRHPPDKVRIFHAGPLFMIVIKSFLVNSGTILSR